MAYIQRLFSGEEGDAGDEREMHHQFLTNLISDFLGLRGLPYYCAVLQYNITNLMSLILACTLVQA
ncbi:hypothetical protein HI914_07476 [Erysiphe necator]|nr:hypothetical protein HI914_07476 [Erysiphe necator]